MKQRQPAVRLIWGYLIPYVFLAMKADEVFGTPFCYGVMFVCCYFLARNCALRNNGTQLWCGALVSSLISLLCLVLWKTEKWDWYFKPFSGEGLLMTYCTVFFVLQVIIYKGYRKKTEGNRKEQHEKERRK